MTTWDYYPKDVEPVSFWGTLTADAAPYSYNLDRIFLG